MKTSQLINYSNTNNTWKLICLLITSMHVLPYTFVYETVVISFDLCVQYDIIKKDQWIICLKILFSHILSAENGLKFSITIK